MKKVIFLSSLLLLIFSSCKKSKRDPLTSVSFEINGTKHTWESQGSSCTLCGPSTIQNFQGKYYFNAIGSNSLVEFISISLESSTISVATYTSVVSSPVIPSNAKHSLATPQAYSTQPGDFGTVQITSIHNGYADGFFSAKLTLSPFDATAGKVDIVNGEFKNVKID